MPEVKKIHKHLKWGYQYGKEGTFHPITKAKGSEERAKRKAEKDAEQHKKTQWYRSNIVINWLGI